MTGEDLNRPAHLSGGEVAHPGGPDLAGIHRPPQFPDPGSRAHRRVREVDVVKVDALNAEALEAAVQRPGELRACQAVRERCELGGQNNRAPVVTRRLTDGEFGPTAV